MVIRPSTKLDCFVGDRKVVSMVMGEAQTILPGVLVTVLNEQGDILVEILDQARQVRVGEKSAIDVTQIRTGESFFVDDLECFVLQPYQVHVSQKGEPRDLSLPTPPRKVSSETKYPFQSLLPAMSCLAVIIGVCGLFGENGHSDVASPSWPDFPNYGQSSQENGSALPFTDDVAQPDTGPVAVTEKQRESVGLKETQPPAPQNPTRNRGAVQASASLWREYQEYSLEAKFDPQAGRQKLRDLRKKAPKNSRLRAAIDADLAAP